MHRMEPDDRLPDLEALGARDDDDIDLALAALALAALDHAEAAAGPYLDHLGVIAEAATEAGDATASVGTQIAVLRDVIVGRHGYVGDRETYEDLRNANLMDVIDRRRGLPVALGILYLHAARSYGGEVVGLNFPSHFLLRIEARGQRVIVDPFAELKVMEAADLRGRLKELHGADAEIESEHYAPVGNRDILIRLQNNIKVRAVGSGDLARALAILRSMTAIAPDRPELWWETAIVHYQLGNVRTAIRTLERFLDDAPETARTGALEDLLRRLRSRMN